MLFGIFSVVSATSLQLTIGLLNDPTALRLWLSRGKPSADHIAGGPKPYPEPYDRLPLESSVSAILVIQFPRALLNLAVFVYLVGFGLYLIFSWREKVPDGSSDYRNIFIVYIICLGLSLYYYCVCLLARVLDAAKVSDDFNFQRLGTTSDDSFELQGLDSKLKSFQHDKGLATELRNLTLEIVQLRQTMAEASNDKNGDGPFLRKEKATSTDEELLQG